MNFCIRFFFFFPLAHLATKAAGEWGATHAMGLPSGGSPRLNRFAPVKEKHGSCEEMPLPGRRGWLSKVWQALEH